LKLIIYRIVITLIVVIYGLELVITKIVKTIRLLWINTKKSA
jgi:hypothetical protein